MKDLVPKEILTDGLLEHPAVRAWSQMEPEQVEPEEIQTLKRANKSEIYRLRGVGPDGSNVIAKRCLATSALIEHTVYQEVLQSLGLPALQCYGLLEDERPGFRWLFIEDAGTQPYLPSLPKHRAALARWLAILHSAGQELPASRALPQRGPAYFLEHLRLGRARIQRNLANRSLTHEDSALLERIISQCDFLESRWEQVEQFCEGMPWTLVHGDLKEKNLRVREGERDLELLSFDWETAGWGLTGPDLIKCPDLDQYRWVAQERWPWLAASEIARMSEIGVLFRMLAETHWESSHLEYEWLERVRLTLRRCHDYIVDSLRVLGIN